MDSVYPHSDVTERTAPTIFAWATGREPFWNRPLLWLLAFSLGGHIASFYLLQVLYTTPAALPPKAVQITLPSPRSKEGKALAQWLAVADPALAVTARQPSARTLLAQVPVRGYTPSVIRADRLAYSAPAPEPTIELALSDWAEPGRPAVLLPRRNSQAVPPPYVLAQKSNITLSKNLVARLPPDAPLLGIARAQPTAESQAKPPLPLQPAIFLLGVRTEGGQPMVFQRVSSGRAADDEAARAALATLQFTAASAPLESSGITWGEAQVLWGRDAYP